MRRILVSTAQPRPGRWCCDQADDHSDNLRADRQRRAPFTRLLASESTNGRTAHEVAAIPDPGRIKDAIDADFIVGEIMATDPVLGKPHFEGCVGLGRHSDGYRLKTVEGITEQSIGQK